MLAAWQVGKSSTNTRKGVAVYKTNYRYPHIRVEAPRNHATSLTLNQATPVEPTVVVVADHLVVAASEDVSRASMEADLL